MSLKCLLYYSDSTLYDYLLWITVFFYGVVSLCYTYLISKRIYGFYKNQFTIMILLALFMSICKNYAGRIVSLVIISLVPYQICNILECINDLSYFTILWLMIYVHVQIAITLYEGFKDESKPKLHFKSKLFISIIIFAFGILIFILASLGDQPWMINNSSRITIIVSDTVFWTISIIIFIGIDYFLYNKVKPVYIYGFGDNALLFVKHCSMLCIFCLLPCLIISYIFQMCIYNIEEDTTQ